MATGSPNSFANATTSSGPSTGSALPGTRGRASQRVGLVRHRYVQRVAVGFGVDGDRADARVAAGPGDAYGDLPAVGDQHLRDRHGRSLTGAQTAPTGSRPRLERRRSRPLRPPLDGQSSLLTGGGTAVDPLDWQSRSGGVGAVSPAGCRAGPYRG